MRIVLACVSERLDGVLLRFDEIHAVFFFFLSEETAAADSVTTFADVKAVAAVTAAREKAAENIDEVEDSCKIRARTIAIRLAVLIINQGRRGVEVDFWSAGSTGEYLGP